MKFWGVLAFWGLILFGCSDCEDCDSEVSPPRTSFLFINGELLGIYQDSLSTNVEIQVASNDARSELDSINGVLSQNLDSIEVQLDSGQIDRNQFIQDSTIIANQTSTNTQKIDSLTDVIDSLSLQNSDFQSQVNLIESGSILLDSAINLLTGSFLTFLDSAEIYSLPLEIVSTETPYQFSIDGRSYFISLTYETIQELNIEREVVVRARNLNVSSHTFDSLVLQCATSECFSNEAGLICYF